MINTFHITPYKSILLTCFLDANFRLLNTLLNAETTQACHRHLATTEIRGKA